MNSEIETLLSGAKGDVSSTILTRDGGGILRKGVLSERPVYELLKTDEQVHYVLINGSGVSISDAESEDSRTHAPTRRLRAVTVVTNQRVVFGVGRSDGDVVIEVHATEITDATLREGFLKTKLDIETSDRRYTFPVKSRTSSDPGATAEYIQEQLTPVVTDGGSDAEADGEEHQSSQSMPGPTLEDLEGPWAPFISNWGALDHETKEILKTVATRFEAIDTRNDSLRDIRDTLQTNHQELESVKGRVGVDDAYVTEKLEEVENDIERLKQLLQAISKAKRKIALYKDESEVAEHQQQEALEVIDEAIAQAESFGRPTEKLERHRKKISSIDTSTYSTTAAQSESTPADESSSSPAAASDKESSESDQPTREEFLDEIEQVAEKIEKRPTMGEFDEHGRFSSSTVYELFDGWGDAVDAAEIDVVAREEMLEELRRVDAELGCAPLTPDVNEHCRFSAHDYRREFGSVDEALVEAGIELEQRVLETVRQVSENTDGKPELSDFGNASPHSEGVIYKFFDSWDDAVAAVKTAETAPATETIASNELSERYELLRNLRTVVSAISNATVERVEDDDLSDPLAEWHTAINQAHNEGFDDAACYGAQHQDRNDFSMQEYRSEYGNGERTTEFEHTQAAPLTPGVATLVAPLLDTPIEAIYLPVDSQTGARLPVIVESEEELNRAVEMLHRLPPEPEPASPPAQTQTPSEGEGEAEEVTDTTTGSEPTTSGAQPSNLMDVNGVTESIAQALAEAGYTTRKDLQDASLDELSEINAVGEQGAYRIKLDVGG